MPERGDPASVHAVAPGLGAFPDRLLFGDIWRPTALSPRDRSLVTMVALIAIGQPEQLPFHASRAMDNGLSADEARAVGADAGGLLCRLATRHVRRAGAEDGFRQAVRG